MRRLTQHDRDDRGVVTLFVIGAIGVLLVATACAIDVGRHVTESWSAQNSADATVVAVATDCARTGSPIADYSPYHKFDQSITTPACGIGETTITVTKPVSGGLLLNRDARVMQRSATARWGTIGTATTLPITIANCEFTEALPDGMDVTTPDITLLLDNPQQESGCSSLPGGFSQLAADDDCEVTVSADNTADGKPGNDLRDDLIGCIVPLPQDVLIPMYDAEACQETDCNGQGPYPIVGFAMFRITGYWFTNNTFSGGTLEDQGCPEPEPEPDPEDPGPGPGPGPATGPANCINGDFIRFVTSQGTPGPSDDFGTYSVYLSS